VIRIPARAKSRIGDNWHKVHCVTTPLRLILRLSSPRHFFKLPYTCELTQGMTTMTLMTSLKTSIAAACILAFTGCTDLKPIQAQIDDLKSQVSKLQTDTAKAESDAVAAKSAAASAGSAATGAQGTANQALAAAQANSTAIEALNEKIDRMFHKSLSK
jgi:murein lipoprotein